MTEFVDHLPHNPDCIRADWREEFEAGSNMFPILRCWGCDYRFIIGGDDLYGLTNKERYRIIKEGNKFIGYKVIKDER